MRQSKLGEQTAQQATLIKFTFEIACGALAESGEGFQRRVPKFLQCQWITSKEGDFKRSECFLDGQEFVRIAMVLSFP
jgi:hypothetical protein